MRKIEILIVVVVLFALAALVVVCKSKPEATEPMVLRVTEKDAVWMTEKKWDEEWRVIEKQQKTKEKTE